MLGFKVKDFVTSEITVIIDDYDTGEVIYEGPLYKDYATGISSYPMSVEWLLKDGRPIALVTIKLGEKLAVYKRMRAAEVAYESFTSEPVYKGLSNEERELLRKKRWPEHERLSHEFFSAQTEFEDVPTKWKPIRI